MRAAVEGRRSRAAEWSRSVAAFAAVLLLTSVLVHRYGLLETVPFFVVLGLVALLAFLGLCLAIAGFVQMWERGVGGLGEASLGLLLSLLVLTPYGICAYLLFARPPLVDVSTDISRPPQFAHAAALREPLMNVLRPVREETALLQREAYPGINGRRYEHPKESVLEAVRALLEERRWSLLGSVQAGGTGDSVTLEAAARSYLLGLPADIAIRIEDRWNATFVDIRSASRYGRHDMGDNAARIERFLNDLDLRMEARGPL